MTDVRRVAIFGGCGFPGTNDGYAGLGILVYRQMRAEGRRQRGKRVIAERYAWPNICDRYLDALRDARYRFLAGKG